MRVRIPALPPPLRAVLSSPWSMISLGAFLSLNEFRFYDVEMYEDDAAYVLGALSMASGTFLDFASPAPRIMTTSFPGLSLLLAPFAVLVSPSWHLLKWVPWAVSIAANVMAWRLFSRCLAPGAAWMVLVLWVFTPVHLRMSVRLMTEPFLLLAAWVAMECVVSHEK